MSTEPKDVYLNSVRWHKVADFSDSGIPFLIGQAALADASRTISIKGEMVKPLVGENYRLWGHTEDDPKYGETFRFYSYQILANETGEGVCSYLQRYAPSLGKVLSKKIVDHFGSRDCLKILRGNPARVKEISGVGPATANEIIQHFTEDVCPVDPVAYASLYDLISEKDATPISRIVEKIVRDFSSSASTIIRENPYILLNYSGIGWQKVDRIAIKKCGYKKDGIERHRAAILETMRLFSGEGDTCVDTTSLEIKASQELKVNFSKQAVKSLIDDGTLTEEFFTDKKGRKKQLLAYTYLYEAEKEIAWRLKNLIDSFDGKPIKIDTTGLDGEQIDACKFIEKNPICLLLGPPGVGKTTTATKIIETFYKTGEVIVVAAPTGKAAKRLSEVLEEWIPGNDIEKSTIHKALKPIPAKSDVGVPEENAKFGRGREKFIFQHSEENPISLTCGIIDEGSMIDTVLFLLLLRALPPGVRLLIVGDENQLPSVGPGAVLRDMIEGGIPKFALTKPRRNSGDLVKACHSIRDGRIYVPSKEIDFKKGWNLFHIEESDPNRIPRIIVDLHDCTERDPLWDLQVISPQNTTLPIACENLNNLLSLKLNPNRSKFDPKSKYAPGDKIVRNKNGFVDLMTEGYDSSSDEDFFGESDDFRWNGKSYNISKTYVVNGDIGQVVDIDKINGKKWVIVQFKNPDRLCRLVPIDANIELAYAMTVHKAQGSGFPFIIVPVHDLFYWNDRDQTGLWHRELLYTMLSRGIDGGITVGKFSSIEAAISRRTIDKRKTFLSRFIKQELRHAG